MHGSIGSEVALTRAIVSVVTVEGYRDQVLALASVHDVRSVQLFDLPPKVGALGDVMLRPRGMVQVFVSCSGIGVLFGLERLDTELICLSCVFESSQVGKPLQRG